MQGRPDQARPDQTTAGRRPSNFKQLLIITIVNIIIVDRKKVTGQSASSNSLVAPRTPLRQHSPQIIQQSKQNLHLICHSAAVPKAALRGPSTMSTESPVSQPQTLFLFRSVTFTFTSTPIAQTTTTTPKNRLHCTKQDRNS